MKPLHYIVIPFLMTLVIAGRSSAQNSSTTERTAVPNRATESSSETVQPVELLRSENGELVPVVRDATFEEFLEFLESRKKEEKLPDYSLSRIDLEGEANGERAKLRGVFDIVVHATKGKVTIPLRLGEGVLTDFSITGPRENPLAGPIEQGDAQSFWFGEPGKYRITVELSVPIRRDFPSRRLQLSLPSSAVSQLKLKVPHTAISLKTEERTRVTQTSTENETLIHAIGLGNRVDLTWQPIQEDLTKNVTLETRDLSLISLSGDNVLLEIHQRIQLLQGQASEIKVQIPDGFELLKIEGGAYLDHMILPPETVPQTDASKSGPSTPARQVLVRFNSPKAAADPPIDFVWMLQGKQPQGERQMLLQGLLVEKARVQSAYVAIRLGRAYRLIGVDEAYRVSKAELTKLEPAFADQFDAGFRILRHPAQVRIRYEKFTPYLTKEPVAWLHVQPDRLTLDLQTQFRPGINEVVFSWPRWKEEGWRIEPADSPEVIRVITDEDPGMIKLQLIESNQPLSIKLRAKREGRTEQGSFSLPTVQATGRTSFLLGIGSAENLDVQIRPEVETNVALVSVLELESIPEGQPPQREAYRVESNAPEFSLRSVVQPRKLSWQSMIEVKPQPNGTVEYSQRISGEVAYERISELSLLVPANVADQYKFSLEGSGSVVPLDVGGDESGHRQIRIPIDPPRLGRFEIIATLTLPYPFRGTEEDVSGNDQNPNSNGSPQDQIPLQDVPLIIPQEGRGEVFRVVVLEQQGWRISIPDVGFRVGPSGIGRTSWSVPRMPEKLQLSIQRDSLQTGGARSIRRSAALVVFSREGHATVRAQFLISGSMQGLVMKLPDGAKFLDCWSGKESISSRLVLQGQGRLLLEKPPEEQAASRLISVDYLIPGEQIPRLGSSGWVELPTLDATKPLQPTIWEVVLPIDQHLFHSPVQWTPLYQWGFENGVFRRIPTVPENIRNVWLDTSELPPELLPEGPSNHYYYSSLSAEGPHRIVWLALAFIVLIGSGLSLTAAFVLLSFRWARHMLMFLAGAFLVAFISIWFLEPVLVLAQPAGLGLVLAVLAALIQGIIRRTRQPRVLSLATPSALLANAPPPEPIPLGSNELTADRIPVLSDPIGRGNQEQVRREDRPSDLLRVGEASGQP